VKHVINLLIVEGGRPNLSELHACVRARRKQGALPSRNVEARLHRSQTRATTLASRVSLASRLSPSPLTAVSCMVSTWSLRHSRLLRAIERTSGCRSFSHGDRLVPDHAAASRDSSGDWSRQGLGRAPNVFGLPLLPALRSHTVFVRPSRAEGGAVSVREAQSAGVPVVASDVVPRPPGVVVFRQTTSQNSAEHCARCSTIRISRRAFP
jgi:glycosyltransferase involved in cell wall biosynthesis